MIKNMVPSSRQLWFLRRSSYMLQYAVPAVSGCCMLCASMLPWLLDPLGRAFTAWDLPVDIGWQFRLGFVNYGLLCLCAALYAWLVAYANWRPLRGQGFFARRYVTAGICCIAPILLFLWQCLCVDVQEIAL